MANAHNNFKPRRSRRSGRKKMKLIKSNLEIMKKYLALLLLVFITSCTTVKYVYVDPKDSVVRRQRVIHDDVYLQTPLFYNYPLYRYPIIIHQPPIRVPRYTPAPRRGH